jgi:hypothetical protein
MIVKLVCVNRGKALCVLVIYHIGIGVTLYLI